MSMLMLTPTKSVQLPNVTKLAFLTLLNIREAMGGINQQHYSFNLTPKFGQAGYPIYNRVVRD
jgi:hypothetical protein